MFDKNGDGVLTRDEFAELIGAVTGKQDDFLGKGRDERDILQMYTQAIDVRQLSFPSVCLAVSSRRVFPWLYRWASHGQARRLIQSGRAR